MARNRLNRGLAIILLSGFGAGAAAAEGLIEGNSVRSRSSTIVNARIGHELGRGARLAPDVFNVLNARANDVDYFYASRQPGEPSSGVEDIHTHPAESLTARLSVLYSL